MAKELGADFSAGSCKVANSSLEAYELERSLGDACKKMESVGQPDCKDLAVVRLFEPLIITHTSQQ